MSRHPRAGAAVIWALVVLSAITLLSVGLGRLYVLSRRTTLEQEHKAQAFWLARGGVEIAAEKLLASADYKGETLMPVPGAELAITVAADPASPGQFTITSQARFPVDGPETAKQIVRAVMKRSGEPGHVRLDRLPEPVTP